MMWVIVIILSALLVLSIYFNVNLFYKVEKLEEANSELSEEYDLVSNFILEVQNRLVVDYQRIKEVDARGSFEADDEVGFIFKTLYSTIQDTYSFLKHHVKIDLEEEEDEREIKEKEEI